MMQNYRDDVRWVAGSTQNEETDYFPPQPFGVMDDGTPMVPIDNLSEFRAENERLLADNKRLQDQADRDYVAERIRAFLDMPPTHDWCVFCRRYHAAGQGCDQENQAPIS